MIRILLVEDDAGKAQRIATVLGAISGVRLEDVTNVADAHSAKKALAAEEFDLLIVDIAIPSRVDKPVSADEGARLVDAIFEGSQLKVPKHIIGVTAFAESFSAAEGKFGARMLTVVKYDPTSEQWQAPLQARVEQIVASTREPAALAPRPAIAIVCALESPELESVRRLPWDWKPITRPGDHAMYWQGVVRGANGVQGEAYCAACPRMGMPSAAVVAGKMIAWFRPKYLAMCGIAAGVRGRVEIGHLVVANPSWDWGNGKWLLRDGEVVFAPAPHQLPVSVEVRAAFGKLKDDASALGAIRSSFVGPRPSAALTVHIGPVASGAAVLADGETVLRVLTQHRELLGIDMETYGVFAAAEEASQPRPTAFAVKGVVDFADPEKQDGFQAYAAHVSASAIEYVVTRVLTF